MLTDRSEVAQDALGSIYENAGDIVLINGLVGHTSYCNGCILISANISALKVLFESISASTANIERILGVSYGGYTSDFPFSATQEVLADAEALILLNHGVQPEYYKLKHPYVSFKRLQGLRGKWAKKVFGVQNFQGREFRLATSNCSMFSSIGQLNSHGRPSWMAGSDMMLIKEIARRLNFTLRIVLPDKKAVREGNMKANIDDIIGKLVSRQADVAACGIWLANRTNNSGVIMTNPLSATSVKILVPKPHVVKLSYSVIFIFQPAVWILILISMAVMSGCLSWAARQPKLFPRRFTSFGESFFHIFSVLVLNNIPVPNSTRGPVLHIITWWVITTVVLTSFSSCLISHLTQPHFSDKPNTVQQLIDDDYVWA